MRNGTSMHSCFTTTRKRVHLKANMQFKKGEMKKNKKLRVCVCGFVTLPAEHSRSWLDVWRRVKAIEPVFNIYAVAIRATHVPLCGGNNAIPGLVFSTGPRNEYLVY